MAHLGDDTVEHLAKLCRIACTDEEKKGILRDLNSILAYVERLDECPTEGVEPISSVIEGQNALSLRDDIEEPSLSREDFFRMAPATVAGLIKVPTIIEE